MNSIETQYPRYTNLDGCIFYVGKGLWGSQYMTFKKSSLDAPGMHRVISPNLPPRETPQEAQEDLDEYAIAHNLTVFDYQNLEDDGPEALEGYPETEDSPKLDPSGDTPEDPAGETEDVPTGEEVQESAGEADQGEQPETDSAEDASEDFGEDTASIPAGEPVSLRDGELEEVLDACDQKLSQALRLMFETDQRKFDLNAKITFIRQGGMLKIKYETGFKFDPINYKDKDEICDDIPIAFDAGGNPIIPRDREKQLTFDDVEDNAARMTTTVDGQTGLVERVEIESKESPEDYRPSFCNNRGCPFFIIGVGEPDLCDFDPEHDRCNGSSDDADICEAVSVHHCTRPEVLETYNQYYSANADDEKGDDEA